MKKLILLSLFLLSCTSPRPRQPQSQADLLPDLQSMKADIESKNLNADTCHDYLQNKLDSLKEERMQEYASDQSKQVSEAVMLTTWQIRLVLHQHLAQISSCRTELRQIFYRLRAIEDLASLNFYSDTQSNLAELGDMQKQPVPLVDNDFYHGYLGSDGLVDVKPVDLQSGDLLLTRGGSNFSAVLSSIMVYPGQLDHFVLIHKDSQSQKLSSIESYAQTGGVSRFDIDYALKNENPRMLLLRAKDQALSARAAQIMMDDVILGEKVPSQQIRYDYVMDLSQDKKMTCSAVAYWGFDKASQGQFVIPEERSKLLPNLTQVYEQTGIKSTPMLTAEDMELDSRFDLILEFRDHRLIEDSRIRESVGQALLKWMNDDHYKINMTFKTWALDKVVFPLHRTKLWPVLKHLVGTDFPKDAPLGFIKTLDQINDISDLLYKKVHDENEKFLKNTGWSMTHDQMISALESYRQQDLAKCMNPHGPAPELHRLFSPTICPAEQASPR